MIYDYEYLNEIFKENIKVRIDKVIMKSDIGQFVIPSKITPLINKKSIKLFFEGNTEPIKSADKNYNLIKNCFNTTHMESGRCFNNVSNLINNLNNTKIDNDLFKVYVGWGFIVCDRPFYHCIVVYDNNKILDYSISKKNPLFDLSQKQATSLSIDDMRTMIVNRLIEEDNLPNHKVKTFGQLKYPYIFVGTECTTEQGFKTLKDLVMTYPNHPLYEQLKPINPTQKQYYEQKK